MKHFCAVLLCSLVAVKSISAVDYSILPSEIFVQPCPGKEDIFIQSYWNDSNLIIDQIDDETVVINGYAILIRSLSTTPYNLNLEAQKYKEGRWVDCGLTMKRNNICQTFFNVNEVWHGLVEGMPRDCPPKKGQRYDFHNRSLNSVTKNLSPGLEGLYKVELNFESTDDKFCLVVEGELVQKKNKH